MFHPVAAVRSPSASIPSDAPARARAGALSVIAASVCLGLAACGGGGGASAPTEAQQPVTSVPVVLSGVAATGAPMTGATVRVVDARGVEVGRSAQVGDDGRFSVPLPPEARAPFVLEAALAGEAPQISVLAEAPPADGTVNITPITSLIAARLSPNGLPQGLVAQFEQAAASAGGAPAALPSPSAIQASTQDVLRIIEPVRQALGDTTDPVTGSFAVGGRGHDKLLDSLAVTITPKADASANIEVTVRTKRDDETPMPAVAFSSDTPAQQLPQVDSTLRREHFGAEGTSAKIDALVAELNACYALPVTDRVTSTTITPRTAALVKEGPCKAMYHGGDPTVFLDNGAVVGNGAGNGLFIDDVTVFDRPVYEYTRASVPNGAPEMVVFTVRWTNQRTLASDSLVVHAREDDQGRLKLYGNQYRYSMSVRPIVLRQTHLRVDSRHMDNLRSGYNLLVPNVQQGGAPLFDRVEVMAPVGLERSATRDVFVLRPMTGFSHLRMTGQFLGSRSSNVVWMGADWIDSVAAATTPTTSGRTVTHPIELDGGGAVWVNDPQGRGWSDERLERLSHKSVWTFRYFLRGNTTQTPDAVQSMTTISRAPSVREARQQRMAEFNAATVDWLRSMSMEPAASLFWLSARADQSGAFPAEPPAINLGWQVPAGAVAPTSVNGFGRTAADYAIPWEQRTAFDRLVPVASTLRETPMTCSTSSPTLRAILCHDGGNSDRFSLKTMLTDFELWGKDARQVEFSHSYATFVPGTRRTSENPVIERLNAAP
jgi:hypothetical protein